MSPNTVRRYDHTVFELTRSRHHIIGTEVDLSNVLCDTTILYSNSPVEGAEDHIIGLFKLTSWRRVRSCNHKIGTEVDLSDALCDTLTFDLILSVQDTYDHIIRTELDLRCAL